MWELPEDNAVPVLCTVRLEMVPRIARVLFAVLHLQLSIEIVQIPVSWVHAREALSPCQQRKIRDTSFLLPKLPDGGLPLRLDLQADLLSELLQPGIRTAAFAPGLFPETWSRPC